MLLLIPEWQATSKQLNEHTENLHLEEKWGPLSLSNSLRVPEKQRGKQAVEDHSVIAIRSTIRAGNGKTKHAQTGLDTFLPGDLYPRGLHVTSTLDPVLQHKDTNEGMGDTLQPEFWLLLRFRVSRFY